MNTAKTILEIVSYLSNAVLAVVALIALKQIRIASEQINVAKEAISISSLRDAIKIAAAECDIYRKDIIPLINDFNDKVKTQSLRYFDMHITKVENDQIIIQASRNLTSQDSSAINSVINDVITLLNALEGYSIYFASNLADNDIGYLATGRVYVKTVGRLMPIVMNHLSDRFKHTQDLYIRWYRRLEIERLQGEKAKIDTQLIKAGMETITKPIGTS